MDKRYLDAYREWYKAALASQEMAQVIAMWSHFHKNASEAEREPGRQYILTGKGPVL